jgi:hypothetical protein
MARQLVAGVTLVMGLILTSLACTNERPDASSIPAAEATNVRRTAVAEVQAIIANKSTPTPPPEPTATPKPSCPNAIWWSEARTHTGETRNIQGAVIATRPAPSGATLVELGQPYPDPGGLAIVVASGGATDLSGKVVCVAGRINLDEGRAMVQVRDPSAFTVVGQAE